MRVYMYALGIIIRQYDNAMIRLSDKRNVEMSYRITAYNKSRLSCFRKRSNISAQNKIYD